MTGCSAEPRPAWGSYSIPKLFAASDAVCAGKVTFVSFVASEQQPASPEYHRVSRVFGLSDIRCYKGAVSTVDRVQVTTYEPPYSLSVKDEEQVLLFLKQAGSNTWELADRYWGKLENAHLTSLALVEASGLAQLELDVVQSLRGSPNRDLILNNLTVLHGFDHLSEETLRLVSSYANSADPFAALAAFSVLIRTQRPDELTRFCDYLNKHGNSAGPALFLSNFASLAEIRDASLLPELERLARTPVFSVRTSAMDAIRAIKSPSSVPALVGLLDDSDSNIQSSALIALWEIVQRPDEVGPSVAMFEKERSRFVQSWKQWWSGTGHNLYPERRRL